MTGDPAGLQRSREPRCGPRPFSGNCCVLVALIDSAEGRLVQSRLTGTDCNGLLDSTDGKSAPSGKRREEKVR